MNDNEKKPSKKGTISHTTAAEASPLSQAPVIYEASDALASAAATAPKGSTRGGTPLVPVRKESKKTGPKGSYAVRKIIERMTAIEKSEFRLKYYIEHRAKYKLGKEIGISHQLVGELIKALGPLTPEDLLRPRSPKSA